MLYKSIISRGFKKPSKVFLKWIISYMSILIIPLIISSLYYSHIYKVVKKEAMVRQHLSLENVKSQMDNNLNDLMRISTNLQMNELVSSLSYKKSFSPDIHLQLRSLYEDLSIFMITNSIIKEIYIYFPSIDYIVSSSTIYENYYSSFMPSRYITDKTWKRLYDNLNKNSYQLEWEDENAKKLLFSRPLLVDNKTNKPLSIITFEINQTNVRNLLESQLLSCNFSSLTLIKDSVLISTSLDLSEQLQVSDLPQHYDSYEGARYTTTSYQAENQKQDYMIDFVDLLLPDIKLVSLTEKSLYNNAASQMLVLLCIVLLTSISLGAIITYFYSVHNYRPLKEIMEYIKDYPQDLEEKNEYNKIKKMLIKTNAEITTQRNLLKNNYLYKLLTGEIQLSQVSPSIAKQFKLDFPYNHSYVVLLRLSSLHSFHEDYPNNELTFFITENILSELLEPIFYNLYFCYKQSEVAMIINISEDSKEKEELLLEGLNTFVIYCKNHFDVGYSVGVSQLCNNKYLSDAYMQANSTLEYIHLFNAGYLYHYNDTPKESQIGYLDLKNSDYIINLVMSASEHLLGNYFSDIYEELKHKKLSSEDAKSCFYFFYNVTMRLKAQLQYQYSYDLLETIFTLDNKFFDYSLLEAVQSIENLYQQVMELIKEHNTSASDKKIHEVTQYIEHNYFDVNLNLNNIAEHFNTTPSYFSKKFREEYGISIIDYLYKVRISHSLELIKDTSLKITEIAQMVGFQDSNAFIRIFKKYHGCTPGKYKSVF